MAREYIIYCDESEEKGRHYSNFYGGALVRSEHVDEVRETIKQKKAALRFDGEVKWNKISENYKEKYIDLLDCFFDMAEFDKIKIRVMFTNNRNVPTNLTQKHVEDKYFILYYHFIKYAFGLDHSPIFDDGVNLRVYLDKLPDTLEQTENFKGFIVNLKYNADYRLRNIRIRKEDVTEVTSHDHDILQCADIVVGAMHFRLNDKHKEKPEGARIRGKRTRAKHDVYDHINRRIQDIYPGLFNIGITTGHRGDRANRWRDPYRHWLFTPTERIIKPGSKHNKS